MTTIAAIAAEHNMQPRELAAFLGLERRVDYEKQLNEEETQNITDLLEYDQTYNQ